MKTAGHTLLTLNNKQLFPAISGSLWRQHWIYRFGKYNVKEVLERSVEMLKITTKKSLKVNSRWFANNTCNHSKLISCYLSEGKLLLGCVEYVCINWAGLLLKAYTRLSKAWIQIPKARTLIGNHLLHTVL